MNRREFCKKAFGIGVSVFVSSLVIEKIAPHMCSAEQITGNFDTATFTFTLDEIDRENLELMMFGESGKKGAKAGKQLRGTFNFMAG